MMSNKKKYSIRKVSQTAVAKYFGITHAAYNSWEKDKYVPNKKNRIRNS